MRFQHLIDPSRQRRKRSGRRGPTLDTGGNVPVSCQRDSDQVETGGDDGRACSRGVEACEQTGAPGTDGAPPTASFNLEVDLSIAVGVVNPSMISLVVFQDNNDNDVNEYGEAFRQITAAGGNVWCDGATPCTFSASFIRVQAGTYGTGRNGDFTIATTGWYYQQGCLDYSCAKLITTITQLTGAILAYSYYKDSPISSP